MRLALFLGWSVNPQVPGLSPGRGANPSRSILDTSVTLYTGDIGSTFAPKAFSAHSMRPVSSSKNVRRRRPTPRPSLPTRCLGSPKTKSVKVPPNIATYSEGHSDVPVRALVPPEKPGRSPLQAPAFRNTLAEVRGSKRGTRAACESAPRAPLPARNARCRGCSPLADRGRRARSSAA